MGRQTPESDLSTDLLWEFARELTEGDRPNWAAYLRRCRTSAERVELLDDMISTEMHYVGWDTRRVKRRLRLLGSHSSSNSRLAAAVRGLYADRLEAGEFPSLDEFRSLGVPMDRLRLRAENERVFLGYTVGRRYRLEKLLGAGKFGVVYRAKDLARGGNVAVKTLHGEDTSAKRTARLVLKDEARALRAVRHAGIPRFIDLVAERGTLCLVLQYIEGGTLIDLFERGPVLPERAARIVAAIADALDCAHRKGYTHRDLKLGNVLLDKADHPYVADFGLALSWDDRVDREGERGGSPGYSPVESQLGMGRRIDGRADVFSAGVILYELLTGKGLMARDCWEGAIVDAVLLERRRLWFPKDVPRTLRAICKKCLPRDPNNRYHTAGHLRADLNAFLAGVSHGKERISATR